MSNMAREIARHRPDWRALPEELDRAWSWMEQQDLAPRAAGSPFLSPYAHDGAAPAFEAGLELDGRFEPNSAASARLLPIGRAARDGSLLVLWLEVDDEVRAGVLGGEGTAFLVAEDALSLLVLLGVGYMDLTPYDLGDAPDPGLPAEALAPLRSWLRAEFAVEVPAEWPAVGDDRFSAWVDAQLGRGAHAASSSTRAPASTTVVEGDVVGWLALLGEPDGPDASERIAALTGAEMGAGLRASGAALRKVGVELEVDRRGISCVWIRVGSASGPGRTLPAYPRPAALVHGLSPESTMQEALAALGEPEARGEAWIRHVVDGRYLHLEFERDRLLRVTVIREWG